MRKRLTKLFYDSKEINLQCVRRTFQITEIKAYDPDVNSSYLYNSDIMNSVIFFEPSCLSVDFYYQRYNGFKIDCWSNIPIDREDII